MEHCLKLNILRVTSSDYIHLLTGNKYSQPPFLAQNNRTRYNYMTKDIYEITGSPVKSVCLQE